MQDVSSRRLDFAQHFCELGQQRIDAAGSLRNFISAAIRQAQGQIQILLNSPQDGLQNLHLPGDRIHGRHNQNGGDQQHQRQHGDQHIAGLRILGIGLHNLFFLQGAAIFFDFINQTI